MIALPFRLPMFWMWSQLTARTVSSVSDLKFVETIRFKPDLLRHNCPRWIESCLRPSGKGWVTRGLNRGRPPVTAEADLYCTSGHKDIGYNYSPSGVFFSYALRKVARSKAWVWGCSIAESAGSNSAGNMGIPGEYCVYHWSLVQRSPSERMASECDRQVSIMRRS